jgi:hypothetical protein
LLETRTNYSGTDYTPTTALLAVGIVACPVLWFLAPASSYSLRLLAIAGSAACFALAGYVWKLWSTVPIPSLEQTESTERFR